MLTSASGLGSDPTWPSTLCAFVCMLAFTVIASIDGLYFHLYRYRLHRRPASYHEHRLHTTNAILYVPLAVLCFCFQPLGLWRELALALFVVSLVVEVLDVRCEAASRQDLGGLTTPEYMMHFLMSALRAGSMLPLLASGPLTQWLPSQTALAERPTWLLVFGLTVVVPGVLAAALHVYLALPQAGAQPRSLSNPTSASG